MVLAAGTTVVPKSIYPSNIAGAGVTGFGMLTALPLLGNVTDVSGTPNILVDWNNGTVADGTLTPAVQAISLREVGTGVAAAAAALLGKVVRLTLNDASQEYTGLVVSVFQLETATVGGTGALSDVAVVRTRDGMYFISLVSNLAEVSGQ